MPSLRNIVWTEPKEQPNVSTCVLFPLLARQHLHGKISVCVVDGRGLVDHRADVLDPAEEDLPDDRLVGEVVFP